jgi:hypothetical protein
MDAQPKPLRDFIARVEAYLARTGMKTALLGELAVNDRGFVFDLRAGREPRFSTMERVDRFMAEHPDGAGATGQEEAPTCAARP